MKKGHRESTFVVIKKHRNKVYVLQCTSNPHQEVSWKMLYYPLGRLNYNINKNCYINCLQEHELKEKQYIKKIGHLNEYDLNQLKKQIYILINSDFKIKPGIENKYLDYIIGVGDVILKDDNKYYIYALDNTNLYVYRLRKKIKNNLNILINNTYYSFIFDSPEIINKKDKYELVDTFNSGEIEIIKKYRDKLFAEQYFKRLEKKTLQVGALIDYKGNMYYVAEETPAKVALYLLCRGRITKTMANIVIQGGIYKTYFGTQIIRKDKLIERGVKIRRIATKEEIEYNNKVFNLPKEKRQKEKLKLYNASQLKEKRTIADFIPMTVVKNANNDKYYLIIDRKDNIIEVVNINNMGDSFYFELEEGNCPFKYYRILAKEEYDMYLNKIAELKKFRESIDNSSI